MEVTFKWADIWLTAEVVHQGIDFGYEIECLWFADDQQIAQPLLDSIHEIEISELAHEAATAKADADTAELQVEYGRDREAYD